MRSLYEHAGGDEALHRLEELFYSKVLADPILKRLFNERRPHHVDHLTWFTAESFGGPDRFTRELGFQHIIDVHRHLRITDEQRERFVALYLESIEEAGLPADDAFRKAVHSHLEFGSRVAQQNSWAEADGACIPFARFHIGNGHRPARRVRMTKQAAGCPPPKLDPTETSRNLKEEEYGLSEEDGLERKGRAWKSSTQIHLELMSLTPAASTPSQTSRTTS